MLSNLTPEDWEVNVKRTVWKEDGWHRFGLKRYCLSRLCLGIALVWGKWVPEKLLTIHTQLEERVDIKRGACCFESRVNRRQIFLQRPARFYPSIRRCFLYAFVDGGVLWKIGMTKDFDRRRAEWDNQCPFPGRIWMAPVPTMTRRRAESLAHLALENSCLDRPRVWCNNCGRQHVEFFVFTGNPGQVWPTIISPILANAAVA
ncbi:hypothetical protein C8R41DRAFT_871519 [Lentinula lateritia]|uniref:Bacteriophage T5 Orf172 DNA-binding domain-containing protein n=1 Tax=Lentinula lateritia TaxID=40482 RepID=A0ABQ8V0F9_9AGAR|nr:hypothetical protein C8R41DRAFT_871519 [Lentinula lateritia]